MEELNKNQMEILELKKTVVKIKISMHILNSRMEKTEEGIQRIKCSKKITNYQSEKEGKLYLESH